MPRTVKNPKLDTRSARLGLRQSREPYWGFLDRNCHVGYRSGAKGGTWIARFRDPAGQRHYEALGPADDVRDADGLAVFNFAQAQERARRFSVTKARSLAGLVEPRSENYTVSAALADYFSERERKGSKGVRADRYAAEARIIPALGKIELSHVTTKAIRTWISETERAPRL